MHSMDPHEQREYDDASAADRRDAARYREIRAGAASRNKRLEALRVWLLTADAAPTIKRNANSLLLEIASEFVND